MHGQPNAVSRGAVLEQWSQQQAGLQCADEAGVPQHERRRHGQQPGAVLLSVHKPRHLQQPQECFKPLSEPLPAASELAASTEGPRLQSHGSSPLSGVVSVVAYILCQVNPCMDQLFLIHACRRSMGCSIFNQTFGSMHDPHAQMHARAACESVHRQHACSLELHTY